MMKILLAAVLCSTLQTVQSQLKEGKVIYERKMNMHRRLPDESMKSMVPEFNTSKAELDFSGEESIYKNLKEEEDIRDKAGESENRIFINVGGAEGETYRNYATEKMTEQRELGPRKYLIDDSLRMQSWKLDPETKTIKGYTCKKAVTKGPQGNAVVAWYTEEIASPAGPEIFGGLPGLILELNINESEIVFTPLEIVTKGFDKSVVRAPDKGKKISRREFQKMMQDQFGEGPGKPMIRIIQN